VDATPAGRGGRRAAVAGVIVLALLVGVLVGYLASTPAKNDLRDQKRAAQADADRANAGLATTQASLADAVSARDTCVAALQDVKSYMSQVDQIVDDEDAVFNANSQEEFDAALTKLDNALATLDTTKGRVQVELDLCKPAGAT
jgi:hypothetical protein